MQTAKWLEAINHPHRVTILGAVRSGLSAARVLRKLGVSVFVSDRATGTKAEAIEPRLRALDIEYELGTHSDKIFQNTDIIVTSPGVDQRSPLFVEAKKRNIPVWSELELSWRLHSGKTIAVTGTNGKSTVTAWLGECFRRAGIPHVVAGNIGTAFSEMVLELDGHHWAILEVSSFQLDWIDKFAPDIALILNLSPDHLDRYDSLNEYYQSKTAIVKNQTLNGVLVRNEDDELTRKYFHTVPGSIFGFSVNHPLERGVWLGQNEIYVRDGEETAQTITAIKHIGLPGKHNLANACAVAAACHSAGLTLSAIDAGLTKFTGLSHRLQTIPSRDGLRWVNDSKATTPDSARVALLAFEHPVIWLAGGYDKGMEFSPLRKLAVKRAKCLIAFGAAGEKVQAAFEGALPVHRTATMKEAMQLAKSLAEAHDVILMSPMCASFDEFTDYEDRGRKFAAYVEEMQQ